MADNFQIKDGNGATLTKASVEVSAGIHADKAVMVNAAGVPITSQRVNIGADVVPVTLSGNPQVNLGLAVVPVSIAATVPVSIAATVGVSLGAAVVPVSQSAGDIARIGALTDIATADETVNGSVIGVLKGIYGRLRAILNVNVVSSQATKTDRSGVTTLNATVVVMAANAARRGWQLQNTSDADIWLNPGGAATIGGLSFKLPPNAFYEDPAHGVSTTAVNVICAVAGKTFAAREW